MNRYPLWKYLIIGLALLFGLVYTLPNFFGEAPAVQISSAKATLKLDPSMLSRVQATLSKAGVNAAGIAFDANSIKARFTDTDTQLKAKDVLSRELNPDASDPSYVVALNLLSSSPQWLANLGALPMYLGLDLRGGVHFLMQVDMKQALTKRLDSIASDIRTDLRDRNIRHAGITRAGNGIEIRFRDEAARTAARNRIGDILPDLALAEVADADGTKLVATFRPEAERRV